MIAAIFPGFYDAEGRKVLRPGLSKRRQGYRPTFPMGRNLTQPLKHKCSSLEEIRQFLRTCRFVNTSRPGKKPYWQPPEQFEVTKAGICVDFALWSWRQLLDMGYTARFVGGNAGKFGAGHAWVEFEKDGKWFLLEPQCYHLGLQMPRLSTLRYHPSTSIGWDGSSISYYNHESRKGEPPLKLWPALLWEWVLIRGRFWAKVIWYLPGFLYRKLAGTPPRNKPR